MKDPVAHDTDANHVTNDLVGENRHINRKERAQFGVPNERQRPAQHEDN